MEKFINRLKNFLEHIDSYRDKLLFLFIKPYWPRRIIPNHITFVRIIIGAALFVILFFFGIENKPIIIALFIVGALTDLIDGPVARGTNRVTELGAMLDATADRFLIIPIMVYSLAKNELPLLLALILFETANGAASVYYKSKEIYLESNIFGKAKMTLLSIAFALILIIWPKTPSAPILFILWLSVPLSLLAMIARVFEIKNKKHETQS